MANNNSQMQSQTCQVAHVGWFALLLAMAAPPGFATVHFNLESGIPTTLEDIEPIERGGFELQTFGRYLRRRGGKGAGEAEGRLVCGILDRTQLEIATPLVLGEGMASGNGDVQISVLRKLWDDHSGARSPGLALEAEVRLPTGAETRGYNNRIDAGFTAIIKKDVGPHSLHLNAGFEWTNDISQEDSLRRMALSFALGHDMPVTKRIILVSDVVWRQSDEKNTKVVALFESGVRAQLTRSLIGAIGMGAGLNRGEGTPSFSLTVGFQLGL